MLRVCDGNVKAWESLGNGEHIAKGYGVTLMKRSFRRPSDQTKQEYHYVLGKNGVTIFAITTDGLVILKEEFKQGSGRVCLGCPSGIVEKSESLIDITV